MAREITAIELRHHLGEVLDAVANKRQHFLVKRGGIPAAYVVNVVDFEELVEVQQEQRDRAFQRSLRQAKTEVRQGKGATLDDLRADLRVKERRGKRR